MVDRSAEASGTAAQVVVRGLHVDLDGTFREHAEAVAAKLDRFGVALDRIDIEVTRERNPRLHDNAVKVEFTCRAHGASIRAEASGVDEATALDRAVDRIEERLRRAADRRTTRARRAGRDIPVPPLREPAIADDAPPSGPGNVADRPLEPDVVFAEGPVIAREKTHRSGPMTVAAAIEELELVDHDFYLFYDVDAALPSVVYRRRGYDYGVLRLYVDDPDAGARGSG